MPKIREKKDSLTVAGVAFVALLAAIAMWYGVFLPYGKANRYISAQQASSEIRSLEEFEEVFSVPLKFKSPVGGEEIPKFLGGDILSLVGRMGDEATARRLAEFVEPYLWKDEVRHLLLLGQMRYTLWARWNKEEDIRAAVQYYEKAHEIGPKLPQPLSALYEIYLRTGNATLAEEARQKMLALWPDMDLPPATSTTR